MQLKIFLGSRELVAVDQTLKVPFQARTYVPFDPELFGARPGDTIEISAPEGFSSGIFFSLEKHSLFRLNFGEEVKIIASFVAEYSFSVGFRELPAADEPSRLQFLVETYPDEWSLRSEEHVELYVNLGREIPSRASHDLRGSSAGGAGITKMISPSSPYFCIAKDCEYTVTVVTQNVGDLFLIPQVVSHGEKVLKNDFYFLEEELAPEESVTYSFLSDSTSPQFRFDFVPQEGNAEFALETDEDRRLWVSSQTEGPTKVLPARSENKNFRLTLRNKGTKPAALRVEVVRAAVDLPTFLARDTRYIVAVGAGESKRFALDLRSEVSTLMSIKIKFRVQRGNAKFVMGECVKNTCGVPRNDEEFAAATNIVRRSVGGSAGSGEETIDLSFNCLKEGSELQGLENGLRNSTSCMFAVSVRGGAEAPSQVELFLSGQTETYRLEWERHETLRLLEDNLHAFHLPLVGLAEKCRFVFLRLAMASGRAEAALSFDTQFPSADDAVAVVNLDATLGVAERAVRLRLPPSRTSVLAINFDRKSSGSVDFSAHCSESQVDTPVPTRASLDSLITRSLGQDDKVEVPGLSARVKSFVFELPSPLGDFLMISVNSEFELELCVRAPQSAQTETGSSSQSPTLDLNSPCLVRSAAKTLRVPTAALRLHGARNFFISVEARGRSDSAASEEFSLLAGVDVGPAEARISAPGQAYTFDLPPNASPRFEIDLSSMRHSAYIGFDADQPLEELSLMVGGQSVASLRDDPFAFFIEDADHFRKSFCSGHCSMFLVVRAGSHGARLWLTFTVDDIPVSISEGKVAILSSAGPEYLLLRAGETSSDLRVTAAAVGGGKEVRLFSSPAPASIRRGSDLSSVVGPSNFSRASPLATTAALRFEAAELSRWPRQLLKLQPMSVTREVERSAAFSVELKGENALRVEAHAAVRTLTPGAAVRGELSTGEWEHFSVALGSPRRFSVVLRVSSGEASLYMNRGFKNFTSSTYFEFSSTDHRGDEAVVGDAELLGGVDFTVGVLAETHTKFSVLLLTDAAIVVLTPGHFAELPLRADRPLLVDTARPSGRWRSLFVAQRAAVKIDSAELSDRANLAVLVEKKESVRFETVALLDPLQPPLTGLLEARPKEGLLRLSTEAAHATLVALVYEEGKPIEALVDHWFSFEAREGETVVFEAHLDRRVREAEVQLKVERGEVGFCVAEGTLCFGGKTSVRAPGTEKTVYVMSSSSDKSNEGSNPTSNEAFDRFFVVINATGAGPAQFSLFIKPSGGFGQLREYATEVLQADPSNSGYLFFPVSPLDVSSLQKLRLKIQQPRSASLAPSPLFAAAGGLPNPENATPAPLLDSTIRRLDRLIEHEFVVQAKPGFFFVTLPPGDSPIAVTLLPNNDALLSESGLVFAEMPLDMGGVASLGGRLRTAGDFRVVVHACGDPRLNRAEFAAAGAANKPLDFSAGRREMTFLALSADPSNSSQSPATPRVVAATQYDFRLTAPGTVKLRLEGEGVTIERFGRPARSLVVQTEFRPTGQTKFLSEMVSFPVIDSSRPELFSMVAGDRGRLSVYSVRDSEGGALASFILGPELEAKIRLPTLDPSFSTHFPEISTVSVTITFGVADKGTFEAYVARCGFAAQLAPVDSTKIFTIDSSIEEFQREHSRSFASVTFPSRQLSRFDGKREFSLFVYATLTFGQAHSSYLDNSRIVILPLMVQNLKRYSSRFLDSVPSFSTGLLAIFAVFVGAVVFVWVWLKKKGAKKRKWDYERPDVRVADLEMADRV